MKDEASRIYGYTFISKAISKFRLSTKVYIIICHDRAARVDANPYSTLFKACCCPGEGGGRTLGISGWGCAAGTLEPLSYTSASSAEFCYSILRVNSTNPPYSRVAVF